MRSLTQLFLAVLVGATVAVAQSDVEQFTAAFAEVQQVEVERPFEAAVLALREKYLGAVDRELKKAMSAGDLDSAAALKHEKEAFDFAGEPPHPNPTAAPLIRLRQAHAAESKKLESQRAASLSTSVAKFASRIKEKEVELTKAQKIEEALALRNYRIKLEQSVTVGPAMAGETPGPASSTPGEVWRPIFNGKDLTGWKPRDNVKDFRVRGGVLEAERTSGPVDFLFFEGTNEVPAVLRNFELRAKIKADPGANSGFYFHFDKGSVRPGGNPATGQEVSLQCGPGKIEFPTGSLYKVTPMAAPDLDQSDWFDLRFRVQGTRIIVWINEQQFLDYTEPANSTRAPDTKGLSPVGGNLAIQANSPDAAYYFKSIEVKILAD